MTISDLKFPERNTEIFFCILPERLELEDYLIATGTEIQLRLIQSKQIVILPANCRDVRGFEIPKRLFRYWGVHPM